METLLYTFLIFSILVLILFVTQNIMIVNKVEKKKAIVSNKMKFFSNIYSAEAAVFVPTPELNNVDIDGAYTLSTEFELEPNVRIRSTNREIYKKFDKGQKVILKVKKIELLIPKLKKRFELFDDVVAVKNDKSIFDLIQF